MAVIFVPKENYYINGVLHKVCAILQYLAGKCF